MSILILILLSSTLIIAFLLLYISKESFRISVEDPKYEMLKQEHRFTNKI